ncbi:MAG: paraquat-inducible protein A [Opitutaceae bacterium]
MEHRIPALHRGFSAVCVRCGTVLARRSRIGADGPLAFAVAGLVLYIPAMRLPLVVVGKFGNDRPGLLSDGVEGLWRYDMRLLGALVLVCSIVAPLLLLLVLISVLVRRRRAGGSSGGWMERLAQKLHVWAMPEVQVLAVLVSFFKLGDVVDAAIGPGLWCYAAMACVTLAAWRGFTLRVDSFVTPAQGHTGSVPARP